MIIPRVFIQPYEKSLGAGRKRAIPLLARILGVPEDSLALGESETGKPFIANLPGVHIGISHSGGYLAVYVGPEDAGIDLERLKTGRNLDELASFWFSETEKGTMREWKGDPLLGFYRVWTEKEARFKRLGSEKYAEAADREAAGVTVGHWVLDYAFMLCVCGGRGILDGIEFVYADGADFRAKRLE